MTRPYKQHTAGEGGWSEWVSPSRKKLYRMACCDCGLVHELEFSAVEVVTEKRGGWWKGRDLTVPFRVLFRARRNDRETAKMRAAQPPQ